MILITQHAPQLNKFDNAKTFEVNIIHCCKFNYLTVNKKQAKSLWRSMKHMFLENYVFYWEVIQQKK